MSFINCFASFQFGFKIRIAEDKFKVEKEEAERRKKEEQEELKRVKREEAELKERLERERKEREELERARLQKEKEIQKNPPRLIQYQTKETTKRFIPRKC